jgi:hypothetical protein
VGVQVQGTLIQLCAEPLQWQLQQALLLLPSMSPRRHSSRSSPWIQAVHNPCLCWRQWGISLLVIPAAVLCRTDRQVSARCV